MINRSFIEFRQKSYYFLSEICQIRLDFLVANFAQPVAATGSCAGDDRDRILLDAGGDDPDRTLCGEITGQHGNLLF